MAERQVLGDSIHVGLVHLLGCAKGTAALGAFGREQMALASSRTHGFAAGRDFKSLGHCLACFGTFRASHNIQFVKKSAQYRWRVPAMQVLFPPCCHDPSDSDISVRSCGTLSKATSTFKCGAAILRQSQPSQNSGFPVDIHLVLWVLTAAVQLVT
jgi:hypothetical protein